jgi:hypothetical protein
MAFAATEHPSGIEPVKVGLLNPPLHILSLLADNKAED